MVPLGVHCGARMRSFGKSRSRIALNFVYILGPIHMRRTLTAIFQAFLYFSFRSDPQYLLTPRDERRDPKLLLEKDRSDEKTQNQQGDEPVTCMWKSQQQSGSQVGIQERRSYFD